MVDARRAVAVLGVGPGSGKTIVASGLLRALADLDGDVLPCKLLNATSDVLARLPTQQHHERAARRATPGSYPVRIVDAGGMEAEVHCDGIFLGRVPYVAEDTPLLEALTPSAIATVRSAIARMAATAASSRWSVLEGSGALGDSGVDLGNEEAAELLSANVVLVANVRRGGFTAALRGASALLAAASRRRRVGAVLANLPDGIDESAFAASVARRSGVPIVQTLGYVDGWRRERPDEVDDAVYDRLACAMRPLALTLQSEGV